MARIAAAFSEEDLTRYLQLALDLFRDLQFSLQPRFHLEIGLLKMIQAGKLISIEEALAGMGTSPAAAPAPVKPPPAAPTAGATRPAGPSPFEMDRIKKAPAAVVTSNAVPSPDDDWRAKLHSAMTETGLTFSADAIAQSDVALVNGELLITAPKQFQLDLGQEEIRTALKYLGFAALRFKVNFGEARGAPAAMPKPAAKEDEVTERALSHPEVQRFRELFGGEVRTVRNLKEPWNE
jgi:DNA polymerase-3 subunit gamma/tau